MRRGFRDLRQQFKSAFGITVQIIYLCQPDFGSVIERVYLQQSDQSIHGKINVPLTQINFPQELDRFFGKLIRRVGRGVAGFVRSPVGKLLGGMLRRVAKVALPVAAGALGTF